VLTLSTLCWVSVLFHLVIFSVSLMYSMSFSGWMSIRAVTR
jgi:hypothetical protein